MQDNLFTVEDALHEMDGTRPEPPKAAEPFTPAVLPDTPTLPAPGIYFGMPEESYHAIPALSSSGIKKLCASPMIFWAETPWLSEAAREREAEQNAAVDKRIFRTIGKAYHCRLLEGADEYAKRFAVDLSPEDCKGALESTDQIKAAIKAAGEKPWTKVGDFLPDGTAYDRAAVKADWVAQLKMADPQARILSELQRQHRERNAGKAFIPFDVHEQIEIAARMIEADEANRHAVRGGYPEVTLIWYCAETGVPMKARVDRLKPRACVDLKSFDNTRGDNVRNAIRWAIARYNYNLQPSVYAEGVQAVRELVRQDICHAHVNVGINAPMELVGAMAEWAIKWAAETDEPEWWFLFQQKGVAPVTRLVQYPMQGTTKSVTDHIVRQAKASFRDFSERYGCDPWIDVSQPYMIDDESIPPSATESLRGE